MLAAGDFVKIDFGALVGGYHSDMTRTFVLGKAADWQLEIYELVADRAAGRPGGAGTPGPACATWTPRPAQVIADAGYGEHFGHGLGHGVGLQIHEAPGISATAAGTLLAGSVVTVEPGVYLPDRGGVRIEDTLVVGKPELLTSSRATAARRIARPGSPRNWTILVEENTEPWQRPPISRTDSCW